MLDLATIHSRPDIVKSGKRSFLDNSDLDHSQENSSAAGNNSQQGPLLVAVANTMNVTLTIQTLKDASVVPSQTVQMGGKGTYLFAVKPDNTVEQRPVTQGGRYQDWVVVSQGVRPGETVVVEGQTGQSTLVLQFSLDHLVCDSGTLPLFGELAGESQLSVSQAGSVPPRQQTGFGSGALIILG